MRHAKKPLHILNLEKETPYEFTTVQEAIPKLTLIAKDYKLNLTRPAQYNRAVRILRGEE